jgi:hypothetical protein
MIQIVLHRSQSWIIACSDGMQWERGDTGHGWQDKSADGCRAHVVGGVEVSGYCVMPFAGASWRNINQIKSPAAIAQFNPAPRVL